MKTRQLLPAIVICLAAATTAVQGFDSEPVFTVELLPDRQPAVAGEFIQLAAVVKVDPGWHINSDSPGDEFSMPTTVAIERPMADQSE